MKACVAIAILIVALGVVLSPSYNPRLQYTPIQSTAASKELTLLLSNLYWKIPYQTHVFDCSEMSGYLEVYLENHGYPTKIAVAEDFDDTGKSHAWLLVEVDDRSFVPVETEPLIAISPNNLIYDAYFAFDYMFESGKSAFFSMRAEFFMGNLSVEDVLGARLH